MPDPRGHSLQFRYEPPRELVWRRTSRTEASSEGEDAGHVMTGARTGTQTQKRHAPEPEPVTPSPMERSDAVHTNKIDPAMLDRITNNVISQVEKRMRIERERRGL